MLLSKGDRIIDKTAAARVGQSTSTTSSRLKTSLMDSLSNSSRDFDFTVDELEGVAADAALSNSRDARLKLSAENFGLFFATGVISLFSDLLVCPFCTLAGSSTGPLLLFLLFLDALLPPDGVLFSTISRLLKLTAANRRRVTLVLQSAFCIEVERSVCEGIGDGLVNESLTNQ